MTVEDALRDYILSKYLSVRAFTAAHSIPYSTMATVFKRGVDNTNIETIFKICNALSISADELAEGRIVSRIPKSMSADEADLLQKYRTLNRKGKEAVHAHLRIVCGNPAMTAALSTSDESKTK